MILYWSSKNPCWGSCGHLLGEFCCSDQVVLQGNSLVVLGGSGVVSIYSISLRGCHLGLYSISLTIYVLIT